VRAHGLGLPNHEFWSTSPEDAFWDFESLSAIALPFRSTSSDAFPTVKAKDAHPEGLGIHVSTVVELSSEALIIPADADRRFRRLVSSYRLHVVDRVKATILPLNDPQISHHNPPPTDKHDKALDKSSDKNAETTTETPKLFAEAEPRWMLWTKGDGCS